LLRSSLCRRSPLARCRSALALSKPVSAPGFVAVSAFALSEPVSAVV